MTRTFTYDTIVAGGGVSGATTALLLARHGRRVALLEQGPALMPLLRRWMAGGVWCDGGLHYSGGLGPQGSLTVLFDHLGLEPVPSRPLGPGVFDRVAVDGRLFEIPVGLEALRAALKGWFPGAQDAADAYCDLVRRMLDGIPYLNFDLGFEGFSTEYKSNESLAAFIARHGGPRLMADLLGLYAEGLCGVGPDEIPAHVHAVVMGPFYEDPRVTERGGDAVADAFERGLAAAGVDVYCGAAVARLEVGPDREFKAAVTEDGRRFEAGEAVMTFHPSLLADMLPPGAVRPAYLSRLRGLADTRPLFSVYLALDEVPQRLRRGNDYWFDRRGGRDRMLGVMCCPDHGEPRALCLTRLEPEPPFDRARYQAGDPAYQAWKDAATAEALAWFDEAWPEARGRYQVACVASGLTFERYTRSPRGSAYGVKHSVDQIPLNSITSVRGLYLAGQGIHFPGLLGTVISAYLTCSNILGLKTLWDEVTAWKRTRFI